MSSDIKRPQDSEGYDRRLFQQSHRAMVVFDPEAGCFIDSNPAAARIFGYSSPDEVIGKTPLDMAAPTQYDGSDSATASRHRDQSALAQGIESFEWRHQRPNGEIWDGIVHLMSFEHRGRRLLQAWKMSLKAKGRRKLFERVASFCKPFWKIALQSSTPNAKTVPIRILISRRIIENHDGRLTVSSDGSSGTQFRFILPVRAADPF
jgi:PAS domain S-box-containing protein